ncbi:type II secretion system protein [Streptococcus panodentis]|uniref:Prepilin-type cleavage/methylation domain-containing protein n=1 Tax=Streptococcus panodentis TaxID=1581472 RepID=A0ABS5AUQ4_9STRE|nr:prepilin-type N-terminal cleavage/methylation domain-containing protein [Streptococcus panodentis]MBP2620308.1 prepilin-type cleavage/methylation domain-containing protein [Streptococcus panodentis]
MKGRKKHKGFTLVEVLISLVLIGVITAGLLTFFAGSFENILRQRGQNTTNFDIQESFETQLADIKKNGGHGTEVETFTYRVGNNSQSVNVTGQTLSYKDNKVKNIHLFAANAKEIPLDIPNDLQVEIPNAKRYYYVGQSTPGGKVGLKDDQQSSKTRIYTESGWFLSDRSIGNDKPGIVPVGNIGSFGDGIVSQTVFPTMPDDFRQITKQDSGRQITDEMRGRYLTFAARAINSYGRVGNYQEAERIWVMGLPLTGNLRLHTDADLALLKNGNSTTRIPTSEQAYTNTEVRDYFNNTLYGGTIPVLNYYDGTIKQARQLIALDGNTMQFSNHNFNNGYTTSILIGNRQQTGPLLTYKLDNSLTWGLNLESDGRIAVKAVDTTAANNGGQEFVQNIKLDYTKDNSIQVRTSVKNGVLGIEVFVNGQAAYNKTLALRVGQTTHNINNGQIIFGGNTYINEFAVYTQSLSDSNIQKLAEYFRDKYKAS